MKYTTKDADRFRKKFIEKGPLECWNWTASCTEKRRWYGAFGLGEKVVRAHRFSWVLYRGAIPPNTCVCHRCDNPKCVNPNHLFLGSRAENNHNARDKGRTSRKLTPSIVKIIRVSTLSHRELAKQYDVSQHMIWRVRKRITWRHVP